jgi:hypothetical protein
MPVMRSIDSLPRFPIIGADYPEPEWTICRDLSRAGRAIFNQRVGWRRSWREMAICAPWTIRKLIGASNVSSCGFSV